MNLILPSQNNDSHMEIPENILLHVGFKKLQSINQYEELTAGIRSVFINI